MYIVKCYLLKNMLPLQTLHTLRFGLNLAEKAENRRLKIDNSRLSIFKGKNSPFGVEIVACSGNVTATKKHPATLIVNIDAGFSKM